MRVESLLGADTSHRELQENDTVALEPVGCLGEKVEQLHLELSCQH